MQKTRNHIHLVRLNVGLFAASLSLRTASHLTSFDDVADENILLQNSLAKRLLPRITSNTLNFVIALKKWHGWENPPAVMVSHLSTL